MKSPTEPGDQDDALPVTLALIGILGAAVVLGLLYLIHIGYIDSHG